MICKKKEALYIMHKAETQEKLTPLKEHTIEHSQEEKLKKREICTKNKHKKKVKNTSSSESNSS